MYIYTIGNYRSKLDHVPSSLFARNCSVIHINLLPGNCLQRFNSPVRKTRSKCCFLPIISKVCKLLALVSYMVASCHALIKSLFSHFQARIRRYIQTIVNRLMLVESRIKYIVFTLIT